MGPSACFVPDNSALAAGLNASGEVQLGAPVTLTLNAGEGTGTMSAIRVAKNSVVTLPECAFTAPAGKTITIDLNGHTIDRGLGETNVARNDGAAFNLLLSNLILRNGTVTGGNGSFGGAAYVNHGTLAMENVTLTGNRGSRGGGLCAVGGAVVTMKNCAITGNTATGSGASGMGGGVFLSHGTLSDTGSRVTGNTSTSSGGGIHAESGSTMTLDSTLIESNRCPTCGGGIFVGKANVNLNQEVTLNLAGATVIRNNYDEFGLSGVYLTDDAMIHVSGALSGGHVCVYTSESADGVSPRPFTVGLPGNGTVANFANINGDYAFMLTLDGEAALCRLTPPTLGTPDFTLPKSIGAVGPEAFEGAAMAIVYIPDGCTSIGDHAFRNCAGLKRIRIPGGCTLGEDVFDGCGTVVVFGKADSDAEAYCRDHDNCVFFAEKRN